MDPLIHKLPIIMGALAPATSNVNLVLPSSIVARSGAGFVYDPVHHNVMRDPGTAFSDYSAGQPSDVVGGDWGAVNDMGVGVIVGRLMALLKASDGAQIQAFWGDDLIRLIAYNYEFFNALTDDRRLNDEGECNGIEQDAQYSWESFGARDKATDPTRIEQGGLEYGIEYTPIEPKVNDQIMWPRRMELKGYLGDLRRMFLCAPDYEANAVNQMKYNTKYRGLAEVLYSSDGAIVTRSAKALISEKYSIIAVPKEKIAPEDPLGDTKRTGSKFAGEDADIPDFKWGDESAGIRAAQLYDYTAWLMGKYSTDGLVKHEKDWYYPEESEIDKPVNKTIYDKSLDLLKTKFSLEFPNFIDLKIDHRKGRDKVRYYKSRSAISQLDDGSIVIEDGYGSQIIMGGGNIRLTCPGDVFLQPGRSMIAMAPFDAVIRAGNSVDVSASKKDVRIKAERNCMVMGGNDRSLYGGVLIESRANSKVTASDLAEDGERTKLRGITLKAENSNIYNYSREMYLGATAQLALDSLGIIYMSGFEIDANLSDFGSFNVLESVGSSGETKQLLTLQPGKAVVSTALDIGGQVRIADAGQGDSLTVGGQVIVHGQILVENGIMSNGAYQSTSSAVAQMKRKVDLGTKPQEIAQEIKDNVSNVSANLVETDNKVRVEDDSPVKLKDKLGFSFRDTIKDLKLDEDTFILYEGRWQQMLDAGGSGSGQVWDDESEVKSPISAVGSLPYPGYEGWTNWMAYGKVALKNFDLKNGRAKDRKGASQSSEGNKPTKVSLKSGYKIIKKSGD